jgi:predicted transcriptional regulator
MTILHGEFQMNDDASDRSDHPMLLRMTAQVAAAYVGNNALSAAQLPDLIRAVYGSIVQLGGGHLGPAADLKPAVAIKKSIAPDYIVCLEDGRKLKMLKRHLRTSFGLSPDDYRRKWGLPADYPMVAPNYAAQRSAFAKKIGLGRKPGQARRGNRGKK